MDDHWRFFAATPHGRGEDDLQQDNWSKANELDQLRRECGRLEKETAVSVSIALELFRALRAADARKGRDAHDLIMFQYGRYRDDDYFPNLRDLLKGVGNETR